MCKSSETDLKDFSVEQFNKLVGDVLNNINKDTEKKAFLYAFKSKINTESKNPYVTLNYNFYETSMSASIVIKTIKEILNYLREVKFSKKKDILFRKYNINNPKNVVDFIKIKKYDFTDNDILEGIKNSLDSESYKIEYLLNCMKTEYCIAKSRKDYTGLKHTALKLSTNKDEIIIINKSGPIYKAKSLMYIIDFPENENECKDVNFAPFKDTLFKIPFFPHVLIINDYCFFIEDKVESIFGFEEFNKKQAQKFLKELPSKINLNENSLGFIKSFIGKGKNYNYFANFDKTRLDNLKNKQDDVINLLKNELSIKFDSNNIPLIDNLNHAEILVGFLCGNVKTDIYSGDKVIAVNCKHLEVKKVIN